MTNAQARERERESIAVRLGSRGSELLRIMASACGNSMSLSILTEYSYDCCVADPNMRIG